MAFPCANALAVLHKGMLHNIYFLHSTRQKISTPFLKRHAHGSGGESYRQTYMAGRNARAGGHGPTAASAPPSQEPPPPLRSAAAHSSSDCQKRLKASEKELGIQDVELNHGEQVLSVPTALPGHAPPGDASPATPRPGGGGVARAVCFVGGVPRAATWGPPGHSKVTPGQVHRLERTSKGHFLEGFRWGDPSR